MMSFIAIRYPLFSPSLAAEDFLVSTSGRVGEISRRNLKDRDYRTTNLPRATDCHKYDHGFDFDFLAQGDDGYWIFPVLQ